MLEIGLSWLLFWVLIKPLTVELTVAALITGVVFVVLHFLMGEGVFKRRV